MHGLLSFWFSSVDFASADKSEATVIAAGLQVGTSSTVVLVTHLTKLKTAILFLLAQPDDGSDNTEETIYGAQAAGADLLVEYARAADTIKVGAQVAWSRAKAEAFCSGLVAYGLSA